MLVAATGFVCPKQSSTLLRHVPNLQPRLPSSTSRITAHTRSTFPSSSSSLPQCRLFTSSSLSLSSPPSTVSIDPYTWADTAFAEEKRTELGLRGLLPPSRQSLNTQLQRTLHQLRSKKTDLGKYIFLSALRQTNVRLFYATIMQNAEECLPLIYTPVVGEACQKVSSRHIFLFS